MKLDLRSFRSSLSKLGDKTKHTLASLYPNNVTFKDFTTIFETEDWVFSLEVVAVAQVNDNTVLDWIIWVSDEAKLGNYRGYATLVVYDPDNQENYTARSYP